MFDIEPVITKRIEQSQKYIHPLNNPALVRHYAINIKVLQTAPRIESELLKAIEKKKAQTDKIIDVNDAAPLYEELSALEWLLPVVRLRNTGSIKEDAFV